MFEPIYNDDFATIYNGDCLDVLDSGAISEVDGIIADPPYCSGGRQQQGARNQIVKSEREHWFLTDNMGTDTYLWWLRQIGQRLYKVSKAGTHFYCFTDWRQYTNVVTAFESVGWTLKNCIVWDKQRGGAMGSFWRNNHEFITVFSKGQPKPLPHGGFFNVLASTKPQADEHPTVKPERIIRTLVEASGATVILDPFMGSGTTLKAAKDLGIKAVGIELEQPYCQIAIKRLVQSPLIFQEAI